MKRSLSLLVGLLCFGRVFSQDAQPSEEMKKVAEQLRLPEIKKGDVRVALPVVPEGYVLKLVGTDRLPVVDREGNIGKVLSDAEVHFYFQLEHPQSGEVLDVTHLSGVVPGTKTGVSGGNACPSVIPAIREWWGGKGELALSGKVEIVVDARYTKELRNKAQILADDLSSLYGLKCKVKEGSSGEGNVFLTLATKDKQLGEEGYRMNIGKQIKIEGVAAKGVFWGTRTLLQMAAQNNLHFPVGEIRDYPKYSRRGFMLDVGRKFFRLEFLQAYVKIMAYYKMNEFHIHLNDNGFIQFFDNDWDKTYAAFRLECETYPGLTAKDGFYTKRQFTDLQLDGMEHGVNVLPEIDIPAHSLAFSHYRKSLGSSKYGMDHLDLSNPEIYPFFDSLLMEYIGGPSPVFVGPEVHIGTDEYAKEEAENFRRFTDHYLKYVQSFGKRARLWGALTHAQGNTPVTSENVIMNAWYNGYADPKEMMKQGYDLISTPDGWLYIVPAAGYYYDYLNLEKLYKDWEPVQIGGELFPLGHPQILGGTFAVWNDHCGNGISEKDVHHRTFPALQVLAQKMWMGKSDVAYPDFAGLAAGTCEAPGVNLMGKISSAGEVVADYRFATDGGKDFSGNGYDFKVAKSKGKGLVLKENTAIETPIVEIGYDYTVEFEMLPSSVMKQEAVLFASPNASVVYTPDHKLGFRRDGYFYTFSHVFQPDVLVKVKVVGDAKGTSLYVNGEKVEYLGAEKKLFKNLKGKESAMYIQHTLVFPLQYIGGTENGFCGELRSLKVYNKKME